MKKITPVLALAAVLLLMSMNSANAQTPQPVTTSFTINGGSSATVYPNDSILYSWSSSNGTSFSSRYMGSGTCSSGWISPWAANSASGSISNTASVGEVGCTYTVEYTAQNATSQSTSQITLSIVAQPVPTTPPSTSGTYASNIGQYAATFNSSASGDNISSWGFNYGLTTAYSGGSLSSSGTNLSGSFSQNASGLSCGTTYHFRAYATNSAGTSYGGDTTFTTAACPGPTANPDPASPYASNIGQTSATLNGSATGVGISTWGFNYGTTASYGLTVSSSGTNLSGSYAQNITGLTCGTLYHFRAFATNSYGTGYGSDYTFTTSACPGPTAAPSTSGTYASNIGQYAATFNSTATGQAISSWGFRYGLTTAYTGGTLSTSGTNLSGSFSQNATGLLCGQTYHFQAFASNAVGTTYGGDVTMTTAACPGPTANPDPASPYASNIGQTSATLNASATGEGIYTWGFNYGTTASYGLTVSSSGTNLSGSYAQNITGLTCGTTYHFRAFATNSYGTGYGGDYTFTTSACPGPTSVPSTPSGTSASAITQTTATLNSSATGEFISSWGFNYGTTASYGLTVSSSGTNLSGSFSQNITGLTCGTTYHFRAFATNIYGTANGGDVTFTTSACPVPLANIVVSKTTEAAGTASLTLSVGESFTYYWSSQYATIFSATYTSNNATQCGAGGDWNPLAPNPMTGSGSAPATIDPAHAGCIWQVTYTVRNGAGITSSDMVTVTVNPPPSVTASILTQNLNFASDTTFNPGTYSVTSNPRDWGITMTLNMNGNDKTIRSIKLFGPGGGVWSTANGNWPLVVYRSGVKMNSAYDATFPALDDVIIYDLYAQQADDVIWNVAGSVLVTFTDDTTATDDIPITPPPPPSTRPVTGWSWSDTVGWLSFGGALSSPSPTPTMGAAPNPFMSKLFPSPKEVQAAGSYGLTAYHDGVSPIMPIRGYVWSSNIGWIKFGDLTGNDPNGVAVKQASVNIDTGKVEGWVRACAGTVNGDCSSMASRSDGWDGWIELSGPNHASPDLSGNGGVTWNPTTGDFTGFAWGSDVVGWVKLKADMPLHKVHMNPIVAPPVSHIILTGTCVATPPTAINNNEIIKYTATVNDGTGPYTYSWYSNAFEGEGSGIVQLPPVESTATTQAVNIRFTSDKPVNTFTPRVDVVDSVGNTGSLACSPSATVSNSGLPTAPLVQMWLNNDASELMREVKIRYGSPARINWKAHDSSQNEISVSSKYEVCKVDITNIGDSYTETAQTHKNDNPFDLNAYYKTDHGGASLPKGTHTVKVSCDRTVGATVLTDQGYAKAGGAYATTDDELTIKIYTATESEI